MERMDKSNKELADDPFLLASWIAKSMAGELSDEELQSLDEWRMASGRNRRLYDRIVSREGREAKQKHFMAFDKVSGWQGYSKKLKKTEKKAIRWRVFLRYAAILLIPFGCYYLWRSSFGRRDRLAGGFKCNHSRRNSGGIGVAFGRGD